MRARIKDDVAGLDGELLLKELSTGRIANQVPSKVKMVVQLGLRSPALKGELRGSCEVTPDLDTGSVRLAGMDLGYKGDAPNASSIDATVKGELGYDAASGALEAKGLALHISANTGALKLSDTTVQIGQLTHNPAHKRISVAKLQLRVAGTQGGKPLELALDWPELDVRGETLKGSPVSGQLKLGGELPIEGRFSSGAPSGNFDNLRIPMFEALLSSRGAARKLDATLRSDLLLQPEKQSITLDKLGLEVKLEDPCAQAAGLVTARPGRRVRAECALELRRAAECEWLQHRRRGQSGAHHAEHQGECAFRGA